MIEFAFAFPLLLVFLLLLVDFGLALDRRQLLQHAVREGARTGATTDATSGDLTAIRDVTAAQSRGALSTGDVEVCYLDADGNGDLGNAGDDIRVYANFTYRFKAGGGEMLSAIGIPPPDIEMTPSAQMRLERNVSVPVTECPYP